MILRTPILAILLTSSIVILAQKKFEYPILTPSSDSDTLHGNTISDPYRILEDLENPVTQEWLNEQEEIFRKYDRSLVLKQQLQTQAKLVGQIRQKHTDGFELSEVDDDEPAYTFGLWASKTNQVGDIYFKKRDLEGYTKLVDVSEFRRSKSDNILVRTLQMNEDENKVAIAISHSGSDWKEIYVFDLETREQLSDTILHTLGQFYWNNGGFYYTSYNEPANEFSPRTHQTLSYHKLGSSQEQDLILFKNPDTTAANPFHFVLISDDQYILTYSHERNGKITNVSSLISVTDDPTNFFLENFLALPIGMEYTLIPQAVIGDSIFIKADINSPNFKIVVCDKSKLNSIREFIPEYQDKLIGCNNLGDKHLACFYSFDGSNTVLIYNLQGNLVKRLSFPKGNKVTGLYSDAGDDYAYYWVRSFHRPTLRFRLNLKTWDSQRITDLKLPYNPEEFETRYVHFPSKDGTMIPMYIICRKDLKLNGKNPTLLYGYGGYGKTIEPKFSAENILWLLNGGVLAIPNIRGGGAEGSDWAKAGRGINKQNTIDDFIAAGDYLVEANYTNSDRLACMGGSHGGLVVGATITQRPELFKAAIPMAGVFDMIRFSLTSTGAVDLNLNEFGNPQIEEEFRNLLNYSPYHNVKEGVKYPQTLLITGDSDDRVPPFHSYKFLAELQRKGDSEAFMFLKVIEGAGHDFTITNEGYYEDLAFRLHFLFDQLDMDIRMW